MLIKIGKKELNSLLGEEVMNLKPFTGIKWAQDGMQLSTSRTLFLGTLKVKIAWPTELAKYKTNRELLTKALTNLFAQIDERYIKAVAAKAEKAEKKSENAEAPGFVPDPAKA